LSHSVPSAELDRLLAEIFEQPAVIQRLLDQQLAAVSDVAAVIRRREPSAIVLVARGSSDNAAAYGRYLFEVCNQRLTSLAAPSSLTLYQSGPRLERTVVIGISQSGRGEDVVAYLSHARQQGAPTVAIVNDPTSPLAATAEHVLDCQAGPELSIPATKTVTAQMTLLAMLACQLADADSGRNRLSGLPAADADAGLDRLRGLPAADADAGLDRLRGLPPAVAAALEQRAAAAGLARSLAQTSVSSVIGRGFAFPPALEIALKLKETSYTRAEPFSAADFLHGPVALVQPGYAALLIDVGGRSSQAAVEIASALLERGGQPALLRAGELDQALDADVPRLEVRAAVAEPYAPIPALVLGQLLAVELALALGLDPARPRYLHKVTSTR
jgi:glucosamine--fructose-6-phosphate aminotransferase (isomerizing)